MGPVTTYSIPQEARTILEREIVQNKLVKDLPAEFENVTKKVSFEGSADPSIPINWRFAESIAALKGFEASMLNCLISRKYNVEPASVSINTDHASLFFMSPMLAQIIKDGKPEPLGLFSKPSELFPDANLHQEPDTPLQPVTNIYRTKDDRFYHTHGSMNPKPALQALGLTLDDVPKTSYEAAVEILQEAVQKHDSTSLDHLMNEEFRQAGTIAYTSEEYFASEHGQKNSHVGLFEIHPSLSANTHTPSWWPENDRLPSSPKRPLAGLKVIDLCRVIAGPTITRNLAEMGASVMRITSPHVTDMSVLHQDLNWGKWNAHLHLKEETGKEALRELIRDADVVVDGYRPGVMARLGFSREDIFDLVKDRERGIIHVRENCYGWQGPWSHRSGWQQISDACCGVSTSFSKAMGMNEAVTPVFPNSDYCTGVCGSTAVLQTLIKRAEVGGNYGVDVALNYYSQWLVRSVGTYPSPVWSKVWQRHGSPVFHNYHAMQYTLPAMLKMLQEKDSETLFSPAFFESREAKNLGVTFVQVKPVAKFDGDAVQLRYNCGTRGNGTDVPRWPRDLGVEVVTQDN